MTKLWMTQSTKWIVLSIATSSLIGCATSGGSVVVKDKEVCGDLAEDGAYCRHTLTEKKRRLNKKQWDDIRVGWLCTNSTGFNDTETAIEQFCLQVRCDYQTQEQVRGAVRRMKDVRKNAQSARNKSIAQKRLTNRPVPLEVIQSAEEASRESARAE